jgi:hypothetical protein
MPTVTSILTGGALLSVLLLLWLFAVFSFRVNPRVFLQDYPKDIRDKAAPRTVAEKRLSRLIKMPLLIFVIGVPLISSWAWKRYDPEHAMFVALFLNAFGVVITFNVFGLLLDFVLVWLSPKFVVIPGTEGMAGSKDYSHHFRGFLVGTMASVVISSLVAAVVFLL